MLDDSQEVASVQMKALEMKSTTLQQINTKLEFRVLELQWENQRLIAEIEETRTLLHQADVSMTVQQGSTDEED